MKISSILLVFAMLLYAGDSVSVNYRYHCEGLISDDVYFELSKLILEALENVYEIGRE